MGNLPFKVKSLLKRKSVRAIFVAFLRIAWAFSSFWNSIPSYKIFSLFPVGVDAYLGYVPFLLHTVFMHSSPIHAILGTLFTAPAFVSLCSFSRSTCGTTYVLHSKSTIFKLFYLHFKGQIIWETGVFKYTNLRAWSHSQKTWVKNPVEFHVHTMNSYISTLFS